MIQASRVDESNTEFQITQNSLSDSKTTTKLQQAVWLQRARIITALIYILLQIACFIFIIVCIVRFPRCQKAPATEWWKNGVIVRISNRSMKFADLRESLSHYKHYFNMHALWLGPVIPLSDELNPLEWKNIDSNLGEKDNLTNLIQRARDENIRIIIDYPINHMSIQSNYFSSNDNSYFVWNEQGNTSNWVTVNNQENSAWTYNDKKNSFYLHQFDNNNDSIDINYRNNRVFNEIIDSISYWNKNFQFDGYNLPGLSYAYEDYEYHNETYDNNSRTRHLEEDYFLLARIRSEIDKEKILLLDSIDSVATADENVLARYYGDHSLGGVQLASLNNFILANENETNPINLFKAYYNSIFFKKNQFVLWSSLSSNSILNEAFFATSLFHNGAISIDIDRQNNYLSNIQLSRLRDIMKVTRTLESFRVGEFNQTILTKSNLLTIQRASRGSKSYMIIVNFNYTEVEDKIHIYGIKNNAEIFQTNNRFCVKRDEKDTVLNLEMPICLKRYGYVIIRWSPPIQSLSIIF